MNAVVRITLDGLPKRVQEAADTLDRVFPGLLSWERLAEAGQGRTVRLKRVGTKRGSHLLCSSQGQAGLALTTRGWRVEGRTSGPASRVEFGCSSLSRSFGS